MTIQWAFLVREGGESLSPPRKWPRLPLWGNCGVGMSKSSALPDTMVGTGEPATSRVVLSLLFIGIFGLYSLFSNVFGWDNLPVLGDLVPLVQNLGTGGIWYYLIGFLVGVGAIVATLVGEVLAE